MSENANADTTQFTTSDGTLDVSTHDAEALADSNDEGDLEEQNDSDDEEDDDENELGETKRYRVPRTGDRDIVFTGKLIGVGKHNTRFDSEYEAQIYATEGGKFVATRWHTNQLNHSTTYSAQVCESAETVAAFFHITPAVPELKRGQKAAPGVPYLCEDGKKAIERAASFFDDFEALYLEEVD